jgi:hypothetical protein
MARKITDSVQTSKGATSELYLRINETYVNKKTKKAIFQCEAFLNKSAKDADGSDTVELFSDSVPTRFEYTLTDAELGAANFRNLGYNKIEAKLTEKGFTNARQD